VSSVKKSGALVGISATPPLQKVVAGDLHGEIAGKAIRRLHDDDTDAVALDPLHHRLEAGALADRIGTRYRRIVEAIDHLVAVRLPVCFVAREQLGGGAALVEVGARQYCGVSTPSG
jgi:hypothetical protein